MEATPLTLTSGGLARYTSELSRALAEEYPEDDYILLSDQPFELPPHAPPNLKRGGGPRNAAERRWWLWGLTRELERQCAALIHGPDFAVPYLARRPSVLTLHDLSPWMDPAWHHDAARIRMRTPVLIHLGIPTMIVTVSESVRRQAMEWFRIPPGRIAVTPEAAPSWFHPVETAPREAYFLFVGTLEPRKNLPLLVEAWREAFRDSPLRPQLVLAGRRRADFPELPEEPNLRVLGEVAEEELPALYSGATAFVYPSLYEGFGLPVLEAMQCGAPVIASRSVAETASDAALYADSREELARAMREVAGNPELRQSLRERGLRHAQGFSWRRTARLTHEVYDEARRRFGDA